MCYPEESLKSNWDILMTVILLTTCLMTPWSIAFPAEDESALDIVNYTIDAFFIIDMIVIFNSAFHDEEGTIIEDRGKIACNYLKSWFIIDLIAVMPF